MGCDIHGFVQIRKDGKWQGAARLPKYLDERVYVMFAFLTGSEVRNYARLPRFMPPPRGLPEDIAVNELEYISTVIEPSIGPRSVDSHSHSWLLFSELLAVDYGQTVTTQHYSSSHGGTIAKEQTLLTALGSKAWMSILGELEELTRASNAKPEDIRIIFWFDN